MLLVMLFLVSYILNISANIRFYFDISSFFYTFAVHFSFVYRFTISVNTYNVKYVKSDL